MVSLAHGSVHGPAKDMEGIGAAGRETKGAKALAALIVCSKGAVGR